MEKQAIADAEEHGRGSHMTYYWLPDNTVLCSPYGTEVEPWPERRQAVKPPSRGRTVWPWARRTVWLTQGGGRVGTCVPVIRGGMVSLVTKRIETSFQR
ncbi:hypothetical protein GCM10012289_55250 [Nonomuraea cavernae]|uniref:Uncharacterized protein n=1 Tax=Nonomuraea cavernae TaxID=2045107 RepID=A0A917Z6Z3_9ACTN|nr:hypothetical protein GCM10012289_55250 [Nonomuraea cavernae]